MSLCKCGCGLPAPISTETDRSKGWVIGQPKKLIPGHFPNKANRGYRSEDRGYKTPCWIWLGQTHRGYGVILSRTKRIRVYREMYEEKYGPIPRGLEPDHLCSQKDCVNPDHIEPVTHTENVRRSLKHTVLSMEKAREIRRLASSGATQSSIAVLFGVSETSIWYIVNNRQWKESINP